MKALAAISLLTLAGVSFAGGGDVKADLQVKYNAFATAFAKQDIKVFEDAMAPDYVLHVGTKNTMRAAVLADFKKQMASMSNVKWVRTVAGVAPSRKTYVATVKSVFDGDFDNSGKMSHFWNSAVSLDTWVQDSSKKWLLKESRLVSLDAKLDGKPAGHFPPPMRGMKRPAAGGS